MTHRLLVLLCASAFAYADAGEQARWAREAAETTIIRDDWGIAHVYGRTDADAVFGAMYAQAEDDFSRVETNYINALGRLAETEGESKIWQDLRMKLFIDPAALRSEYAESPAWLRRLMDAFADGLNYYLAKHPEVKPRVIHRFEPYMTLSFSEGSIGGDIERINLQELAAFYGGVRARVAAPATSDPPEPSGSNGIAIAPANARTHHALLLINPHTTFFFRSELQMVSEQGLDAYGAATWGQFFIYQGFNDRAGWMHTSSGVDAVDEYLETVTARDGRYVYEYGSGERPVASREIVVPYMTSSGLAERRFTVYRTHHGPVVRSQGGKWVAIRLMQKHIEALEQSYLRTKARDYASYLRTMELRANSTNNTIFADADGDIAYFHGNFIPRRDASFDWTKPVDGRNPAAEWQGLLEVRETPHLVNPKSGWLYNSNNWPWSGAGESSLRRADYPAYVENGRESARGLHAIRVLKDRRDFTLDSLMAAAYDSYLTWFDRPLPALLRAYDGNPDPVLAPQIETLGRWDRRWSVDSTATSLAIFWGQEMLRTIGNAAREAGIAEDEFIATRATRDQMLGALTRASARLEADFGSWKTPWGEINRFQRLTDDQVQSFSDAQPSIPVGFPSAIWGSLASFGARSWPGTKKWYGTTGNSFVAAVEFGPRVRAKAVTAGGESGHPDSPHFDDEAGRYSIGNLRPVYFYKSELAGHTERRYHPGS